MPVFGIFLRGPKLYITQPIDVVSVTTTDDVISGSSSPARTGRLWRWFSLFFVTLLASSILSGCASFVMNASPASPGSRRLAVTPGSLDFGNVPLNSTMTQSVTLASTGTGSVTIDSAVLSEVSFTMSGVTFPLTLGAGQSEVLNVTFKPTAFAAASGVLSISSNSEDSSTATVHVTGTGVAVPVPQLTVSATSLSFGNMTVNSTATETVTLTSTGTEPVTVNGAGISGTGYAVSGSTFPVSLNPGSSLTLQVAFDPKAAGASAGTLTISSNANPATVSLSGTGVAAPVPQLTVSATSLSFGNVTVNSTATEAITLQSTGTAPVTVNGAGISGTGYAVSGSRFPVSLNPGSSLTLQVTFDPKTAGASAGSLTIGSDANPTTVSLSGTGVTMPVPQLTVSATSLSFGNVTVNSTAIEAITLKSTGTAPVIVNGAVASGTGYVESGSTFPVSLNPGSSLTLQVTFDPKATGASAGTLTIGSNANAITVSLSGTGVAAPVPQLTVSATGLNFGNVTVNSTATEAISLKSTGTGPVTLSGVSVSGSGFSTAAITVPLKLDPGQALNLQITFTPTVAGAAMGSLVVTSDSSSNATATVSLSGTGVSVSNPVLTISATSLDFGSIVIESSATQVLTLTSTGNAPVTVSKASMTGSGFTISGLTFPVTLNPTIAVKLTVVFTPVAAGTSTGQLTITSNSTSGSTALVSLSGTATAAQHSVDLSWSAPLNSPVGVSGYRVYRADSNGSFAPLNTSIVTQTSYVDHSVQSGTAYTYYVTSVDAADVESSPSSQIILTIP